MKIVWQSFEGRYDDNPRTLFERWCHDRPQDSHVWLAAPGHLEAFPVGVATVPLYGAACVEALEAADVLVANTHTDVEWRKSPGALYLQTWHGTPLKRIHRDVLWAPPGRLDRLSRDVARWDVLVSPNPATTPRLRGAFEFDGEVIETGYPRNDILSAADRDDVRRRVRADLGIADGVTAVLYTPTWRDDVVFADEQQIPLALQPVDVLAALGPGHVLLVRSHSFVGDRLAALAGEGVLDVSRHCDVAELYLAADIMVTDYSSTMFDFAITGKPLVFYVYDLDRFSAQVRGFYFDLADEAPGPLVRTQQELIGTLREISADGASPEHAAAYRSFQQRYCNLEDGHATERVLERVWKR